MATTENARSLQRWRERLGKATRKVNEWNRRKRAAENKLTKWTRERNRARRCVEELEVREHRLTRGKR